MEKSASTVLKDLYKGEKSALETYEQALKKIDAAEGSSDIKAMMADHAEALTAIKQHLTMKGEEIPSGSGAWGTWANIVMGTASLLGDKPALKALKEGEEHGLKQYVAALDDEIDPEMKKVIRDRFIPQQRNHIREIDNLMQQIS